MDKAACREINDLKKQIEQLKVQIGDQALEHQALKARLATIEHDLIQKRDLFENDIEFLESLLRLTRRSF